MGLNKKLQAFTLAEMMVVLVLAAIVISIAMVVLNLIQKQVRGINEQMEENTEIVLLENALWADMNKRNTNYDETKLELVCSTYFDTIRYQFKEEYTLRNRDTLKVMVANYQLFLDANPVKENKVDAVALDIIKSGQNRKLFIYKIESAELYMNQ